MPFIQESIILDENTMQDHKANSLGSDSVVKLILRLSLPAVVA